MSENEGEKTVMASTTVPKSDEEEKKSSAATTSPTSTLTALHKSIFSLKSK